MNILSIDVEDWYHILGHPINDNVKLWKYQKSNLEEIVNKILELLIEYDQKATFFCLGWFADHNPKILKLISEAGFEIGSHTYSHKRINEYSFKSFCSDAERSIKSIEDIIGKKIKCFRFPGLRLNKDFLWALECIAKLGIEFDSSVHVDIFKSRIQKHTYPVYLDVRGFKLKEFPIPVGHFIDKPVIAGGSGYFRLYPYNFTKLLFKNHHYNNFYFHPRDFETLPKYESSFNLFRNFKNNVGRRSTLAKFEELFNDFKFTDIQSANNEFDWDKCRVFKHR